VRHQRAVRCEGAGLLLLDTRRGHLTLEASTGGMAGLALEVERLAQQDGCAAFVRELRSSMLLSSASSERTTQSCAELLNALAPAGSNLLLAPLVAEDATIGVLALYRSQSEEFQGAEFKLVSIVTSNAATVLKNAISYEQKVRQKVLEVSALYDFSQKISSAASLGEALDSILAIVADMVDYDECFIYAVDHERSVATVKAARFRGKSENVPPEEPLDATV